MRKGLCAHLAMLSCQKVPDDKATHGSAATAFLASKSERAAKRGLWTSHSGARGDPGSEKIPSSPVLASTGAVNGRCAAIICTAAACPREASGAGPCKTAAYVFGTGVAPGLRAIGCCGVGSFTGHDKARLTPFSVRTRCPYSVCWQRDAPRSCPEHE